ncbi:MAG: hypothetical protein V7780_03030 [Colwellia sp.]
MNLTGAFGGVVFILLFNQLNFTEQQSIATSFAKTLVIHLFATKLKLYFAFRGVIIGLAGIT